MGSMHVCADCIDVQRYVYPVLSVDECMLWDRLGLWTRRKVPLHSKQGKGRPAVPTVLQVAM